MTDAELEPKIGSHIKVFLPGESPWAIVTAVIWPGRVMARIDNDLIGGGLHSHKRGNVLMFDLRGWFIEGKPVWCWEVSPTQPPSGPREVPLNRPPANEVRHA